MPSTRKNSNGIPPPPLPVEPNFIRVRGARVHNLKELDVDIPRDKLVVITGRSGSGKSSLAFDTLVAEGQRQFLESLSPYARQFVQQLERPDLDYIEGLQPTLSIDQRAGTHSSRSTVATMTEIYDYMRVMMARLGTRYCPECKEPIQQQSPEEIMDRLLAFPVGTKLMILAPRVRGKKGKHLELFEEIRKSGYLRARVNGEVQDIDPPPDLNPRKEHSIEAVIDRVIVRENVEERLGESLRVAIQLGQGAVIVCHLAPGVELQKRGNVDVSPWEEELISTVHACPTCKLSFHELEPRSFSFNSPYGACPECQGLGNRVEFDPRLVFPNHELSFATGACVAWKGLPPKGVERYESVIKPQLPEWKVTWETPLKDWSEEARRALWRGEKKKFVGMRNMLEQEYVTSLKPERREQLENFRGEVACNACHGSRLKPESRAVKFQNYAIQEFTGQSVEAALAIFQAITVPAPDEPIYRPLAREILNRLQFMQRVGLGYMTLDRAAPTLSGGELQRVRLATSIGSGLVGVCYILDEPSIGLHPRDNDRLIDSIRDLQQQGNSVLVVEHDEAMMRAADHLIDMGPGAGIHGGQIIAQGTPNEVIAHTDSETGAFLSGRATIAVPSTRRAVKATRQLHLEGCTGNNLKNVSVDVPLGLFVCVTGVSGSGKSTLINTTLVRAVRNRLTGDGPVPAPFTSLRGAKQVERLVRIDQSPIGRSSRSNPATFTGIFDEIRKVMTATREAKLRGYKASRFSFNVKGGRCEDCQGQGMRKVEMNFLPDLEVKCETCQGRRFNAATLSVLYKGKSIADILDLSIEEAAQFFENIPMIAPMLDCMNRVGLGYLTLGQSGNTLSGGEAQRLKLATELGRPRQGHTLYILDEPTTGLHFDDIRKLIDVLDNLVEKDNSVIVIEHNLDVMKVADYIIDLGPDGGANGGAIVTTGTPEEVAKCEASFTGQYLREILKQSSKT